MAEKISIFPQDERVKQILAQQNAVLTGDHFKYASGLHGTEYINKDAIFTDPKLTSELCKFLVRPFQARNIHTVAGPQMGGVIVAHDAACELSTMEKRQIWGVYAEKTEKGLKFNRGYDEFIRGHNVLAVEDILNTGGSAKDLIEAIREAGGNVIGLAAIVNRGNVKPENVGNVPIYSLLDVNMESWNPSDCQPCKDGIPLNMTVGHAKNQ